MRNPIRAWITAHISAPLDAMYARIDENLQDDIPQHGPPAQQARRAEPTVPAVRPARAIHGSASSDRQGRYAWSAVKGR
jgi:hypothetical protein